MSWRFAVGENHENGCFFLFVVHRHDFTFGVFKTTTQNTNGVAYLEVDFPFVLQLSKSGKNGINFFLRNRERLGALSAGSDKSGHAWRVSHDVPRLVGHDHLHEHVPGKQVVSLFHFFVVFVFRYFFLGDNDLKQGIFQAHCFNTALQIFLYAVFLSCVCVDDIPLFFKLLSMLFCSIPYIHAASSSAGCFLTVSIISYSWKNPYGFPFSFPFEKERGRRSLV